MAGHLKLNKDKEPLIFARVERLSKSIFNVGELVKDFYKYQACWTHSDKYDVMKLPKDYVEDPKTERAFMVGPFDLMDKDMQDQDEDLIKGVKLEVHYKVVDHVISIKNIFWVV
jgi:hypothetical protein